MQERNEAQPAASINKTTSEARRPNGGNSNSSRLPMDGSNADLEGFVSMYTAKEVEDSERENDDENSEERAPVNQSLVSQTGFDDAAPTQKQSTGLSSPRNDQSEGSNALGTENGNLVLTGKDGFLSIIYNFVLSRKIEILRDMAKLLKVIQSQKKDTFVANVVVWLVDRRKDGEYVLQYVRKKESWGYHHFLTEREKNPRKYCKVPNWEFVFSNGDPYRKKREDSNPDANKPSPLSLSEFARLIVQLRDHHESRDALIDSRKPCSRKQLYAKVRKNACWNDIIAPKFRDKSYRPFLDLSAVLAEVDSREPPKVPRTGKDLLDAFQRSKVSFSIWHQKWSGQRDPEAYEDFLGNENTDRVEVFDGSDFPTARSPSNENPEDFDTSQHEHDEENRARSKEVRISSASFKPFVPRGGPAKAAEEGQRALILFTALRCGTRYEDTELLSLFHRRMGGGRGGFPI